MNTDKLLALGDVPGMPDQWDATDGYMHGWNDCLRALAQPAEAMCDHGAPFVYVPTCPHCGARTQPAEAVEGITLTAEEREWLEYAVDHMDDDSEPEDKTCAVVIRGLLGRVTKPVEAVDTDMDEAGMAHAFSKFIKGDGTADAAQGAVATDPNWCRTCGNHRTDPRGAFCSDGIHLPHPQAAPAQGDGEEWVAGYMQGANDYVGGAQGALDQDELRADAEMAQQHYAAAPSPESQS